MFSDPQFWVAVAFVAFIAAVFNPVRKMVTTSLDAQIKDIKDKIEEAENLKNETQVSLKKEFNNLSSLNFAKNNDLVFFRDLKYENLLKKTKAKYCFIKKMHKYYKKIY